MNKRDLVFNISPFIDPIMAHGKGCFVWDTKGNKYLDIMAGQFCMAFGHGNESFSREIANQLNKLINTNSLTLSNVVLEAFSELSDVTSIEHKKYILLSTGSEANEFALRYARFIKEKKIIVSIDIGYHGLTLETQSLSTSGRWAYPKDNNCISIKCPDFHQIPINANVNNIIDEVFDQAANQLGAFADEIAAIIFEPIISVGGMIFPPKYFFQKLQELANKHNAFLIADECQSGFGRTGKWFAYELYEIIPDFIVFAKSCGLGLPVSGVIIKTEVAHKAEGKLIHFCSHQNDPLSGAALKYFLIEMKKNNFLEMITSKGEYLLKKLIELSKKHDLLKNPRGIGLMIGFDLPFDLYTEKSNPGLELIEIMRSKGVLVQAIRQGKTFRIIPSYTITIEEIDFFIDKLNESLAELPIKE